MTKKYYKGFSTRDYEMSGGSFEIFNVKVIEEDLLNEILTIRGECLYMPKFGTRIPILTFEPNDAESLDIVREDITNVINNDPRVSLLELDVQSSPDQNLILAVAKINYIEFNVVKDLNLTVGSR